MGRHTAARLGQCALVGALIGVTLAVLPGVVPVSAATTYYVGNAGDSTTIVTDCAMLTNTDCTLRDGLAAATSGSDSVMFGSAFPSGTQTIGITTNGTLNITHSVTLTGPVGQTVAIDGGCMVSNGYCTSGGVRIFSINGNTTLTVSNLTIQHGNIAGTGDACKGGGIFVSAFSSLAVSNCTFTANAASLAGGAIYGATNNMPHVATMNITGSSFINNTVLAASGKDGGGAIAVRDRPLTTTNSTFTDNTAPTNANGTAFGGAINGNEANVSATITITGGSFTGNSATRGGAIYNTIGTLSVSNAAFTSNSATGNPNGGVNASPEGGAIAEGAGALTVTGGSFVNNTTAAGTVSNISFGGAIALDVGLVSISVVPATVSITGVTFTGNTSGASNASLGGAISAQGASGAIHTLAISQSMFSGNMAAGGGALFLEYAATTIDASTFSGNLATTGSGGGYGGAIYQESATTTVAGSTFTGNRGPNGSNPLGGAFASLNSPSQQSTATIINSTFTGNTGIGGGVYGDNASVLTLINDTLSANTATAGNGGGIYHTATCCSGAQDAGTITLINTLVGGSAASGGDLATDGTPSTVFLGHHNLIDDAASAGPFTNGVSGNKVGVAAGVGSLGSNGGPTQTIPLLPGSAAIGAADTTVCAAAPPNGAGGVDQRGVPRAASRCSIGAYEPPVTPNPLPNPQTQGPQLGVPNPLPVPPEPQGPNLGVPAPLPPRRP